MNQTVHSRRRAAGARPVAKRAKGLMPTDFPTIGVPWVMHGLATLYGLLLTFGITLLQGRDFDATLDRHGRLDGAVNSAGVVAYGRTEEVPVDVFDATGANVPSWTTSPCVNAWRSCG